jgi:predicted ATPase
MKKLLEKLFDSVDELIGKSNDNKTNLLRYQIGEAITAFYISNKEEIKKSEKEVENGIIEFYNLKNLNAKGIDTEKYRKSTSWDKIKIALSEVLVNKEGGDGYSVTNLAYMQQFYKKYRNSSDSLEKALQLDWSHNVSLLKDKLNDDEREFYLKKAIEEKWTVKELDKQVGDEAYDVFLRTIEECNYKYKIDKVEINNYKSLVNFEINKPPQFLVFAGANATGKSSIFESIEFLMHSAMTSGNIALDIFGGPDKIVNYKAQINGDDNKSILSVILDLSFGQVENKQSVSFGVEYDYAKTKLTKEFTGIPSLDNRIIESFSHIFIDNHKRAENKIKHYDKLWLDGSNTSKILKIILSNETKRSEILEWLQILIPGLESINVEKDLTGKEELQIYEKAFPDKPFTGNLISEGTFNIIALLTLLYQSDEPQFICLEEPETGLNPAILKELVPFFREMAQKYNHHIWVTTHSVSLVSELIEEELIIINKKDGITLNHPCKSGDFEEMNPDEAWMSNMLKGGGLPW